MIEHWDWGVFAATTISFILGHMVGYARRGQVEQGRAQRAYERGLAARKAHYAELGRGGP